MKNLNTFIRETSATSLSDYIVNESSNKMPLNYMNIRLSGKLPTKVRAKLLLNSAVKREDSGLMVNLDSKPDKVSNIVKMLGAAGDMNNVIQSVNIHYQAVWQYADKVSSISEEIKNAAEDSSEPNYGGKDNSKDIMLYPKIDFNKLYDAIVDIYKK